MQVVDGMVVASRVSVAWQHAFGAINPTAALALETGGLTFLAAGAPIARDSAVIDAGFDVRVTRQASLRVSDIGQLAQHAQHHGREGNFSLHW